MNQKFRTFCDKILHNDNIVFTFIRSIASSQASSWTDMAVRFTCFAWIGLTPFLSTSIGCVAGGFVNCFINYRYTFHATNVSVKAMILKYILVWAGSMLLNSGGTQALYNLMQHWPWLEELGFKPDGYFVAATLFTSLMVSWAWNFMLQRFFVYRPVRFDPCAIRIVDWFLHIFKKKTSAPES